MNIFVLSEDPTAAAVQQCDKHIVKMVLESAQMLCTAHRILDGEETEGPSYSGKRIVPKWTHPRHEDVMYRVVHRKHPCAIWTMISDSNYKWHYQHFVALCEEFTFRYGKRHKSDVLLREILKRVPDNILVGDLTRHPLAMSSNPECMIPENVVESYRLFYQTKQARFKMTWSKRSVPDWFQVNAK